MRARGTIARRTCRPFIVATLLFLFASPAWAEEPPPIASAFVFPIGDELDFKKPAPGEQVGFHVSDPYLAVRKARKHRPRRLHYGVDLSNGQSGHLVRAVAAGVVEVSDGNALIKVRKAQRVKLPAIVNGKRVDRWGTRYRTEYKWRNGWGNRIVVRHKLPDGQVVYWQDGQRLNPNTHGQRAALVPSSVAGSRTSSRPCSSGWARPSSWSRTTSRKRCGSATASR